MGFLQTHRVRIGKNIYISSDFRYVKWRHKHVAGWQRRTKYGDVYGANAAASKKASTHQILPIFQFLRVFLFIVAFFGRKTCFSHSAAHQMWKQKIINNQRSEWRTQNERLKRHLRHKVRTRHVEMPISKEIPCPSTHTHKHTLGDDGDNNNEDDEDDDVCMEINKRDFRSCALSCISIISCAKRD